MEMDDRFEFRLEREIKRKAEDLHINLSSICRDAVCKAVGADNDIRYMMGAEEEAFGRWADSFVALYQFVNKKMTDRENMIVVEVAKLEQLYKKVEDRMKTREQLMEEIPELRELKYDDCFDWVKLFAIIDKYPTKLSGRLGVVQIREAILYREVRKGNFTGLKEAKEKLRAEIDLRSSKVVEELRAWTQSDEYKKAWELKKQEAALAKEMEIKNGHMVVAQ